MKIELGDKNINFSKSGIVKTEFKCNGKEITEEFYPFTGNIVQTQVNNIIIQPCTYQKRTFNYRNKEYLKRETNKNRTSRDIGKDFNTSGSTIRKYINIHNTKRPLKNTELLEEMAEKHDNINDIAKEIDAKGWKVKLALEQRNII